METPNDINEIRFPDNLPGSISAFKTPTIIGYKDETCTSIESWGYHLMEKPRRKIVPSPPKPIIELFKLYLLRELEEKHRPILPNGLDFRNVIRDYLKKLCEDLEDILKTTWIYLDLFKNTLIVLTVRIKYCISMISSIKKKRF